MGQRVPACLRMWITLQVAVFITIAKVCVATRGSKHWLVKTRGDVMSMGGHHRRGASKMFLVETKGGHTNTKYLDKKHKYKTRGAGDYSMAGDTFNAQSNKSRHSSSTSKHFACKSCDGCKKFPCKDADKCYWSDEEEKCLAHECVEDADCIGQKIRNDEVAEEGDLYCDKSYLKYSCKLADCNVCEGCKDLRCRLTDNCTLIKKLGENATTCASSSCKTNEDCQKLVGYIHHGDDVTEKEDISCNEYHQCVPRDCKSCEGCKKHRCLETEKCYWAQEKCFPHQCAEDKDCVGQKFDNGEVSEEGDMSCPSSLLVIGRKCEPRDCDKCEGCKDFRCTRTDTCAAIKGSGDKTSTCGSRSCKTKEDCQKFVGDEDDYWVCAKTNRTMLLIRNAEIHAEGLCFANCKSCEGCEKSKCRNTEKCNWDYGDKKCYPKECLKDEDCIGHKFDNNEVSEEGDMICTYWDGKCEPKRCDVCEGCKAFRCSSHPHHVANICAPVRKFGENTTTCVSAPPRIPPAPPRTHPAPPHTPPAPLHTPPTPPRIPPAPPHIPTA